MQYWPWWIGALALGGITITFRVLLGRPLGVSGSWGRIVNWKENKKQEQSAKAFKENSLAASSALLEETLAEFGESVINEHNGITTPQVETNQKAISTDKTPVIADVVFLISMFVGALLVSLASGDFHIQFQLSELHTKLSGNSQLQSWITLFVGGLLVGVGTQMAGGCSSGHGLSGCAQLSVPSFKATAVFFGTAVLVSLFAKMALGL